VLSGLRTGRLITLAYLAGGGLCAVAGVALASRLTSFVPESGAYYLLDSIGAVFVGTTMHKEARPNVPGTLLGVLIFTVLGNGLNLVGLSFYWQGFARGVVLLLVLGLSVMLARGRAAMRATPARPSERNSK
jgi:ribose transport system permease protein